MKEDDRLASLDHYNVIVRGFSAGLLRLIAAKMAELEFLTASAGMKKRQPEDQEGETDLYKDVLCHLEHVSEAELDIFSYVTNLSYFVYATTLLDGFLSGTTRFLFLLFPRAMGVEQRVTLGDVIDAKSRVDLINDIVGKRVREIGHSGFLERLDVLADRFGISIELGSETMSALKECSATRNLIVHDLGAFDLALQEDGSLAATQTSCIRHPVPLGSDLLLGAMKLYGQIAREVYSAVVDQVLKGSGDRRFAEELAFFDQMTTLAQRVWTGEE